MAGFNFIEADVEPAVAHSPRILKGMMLLTLLGIGWAVSEYWQTSHLKQLLILRQQQYNRSVQQLKREQQRPTTLPWAALLSQVAKMLSAKVTLTSLTLSNAQLRLSGVTDSRQTIAALVVKLQQLRSLSEGKIVELRQQRGMLQFQLQFRVSNDGR